MLVLSVAAGCGGGRRDARLAGDGATFGAYRATWREPDETRRFRLLLFAAPPDRIHAEVLGPVGSTEVVLDGGDGVVAISFPGERLAYVGPDEPYALERVLGLAITSSDLVGALLAGRPVAGVEVERDGRDGGLPRRCALRAGDRSLAIELKRTRRVRARADELGRGEALPGMRVRPLEALGRGGG